LPLVHRIALLIVAGALALATFMLGASFTYAAEAPARAVGSWIFWMLFAVAIATPLWLPALVPTRLTGISRIVRWASVLLALVPLRYIATVLLHQYSLYGGGNFAPGIFGVALLLCTGCVCAIVVLMLPDFKSKAGHAA